MTTQSTLCDISSSTTPDQQKPPPDAIKLCEDESVVRFSLTSHGRCYKLDKVTVFSGG
jgi:hypothetical protein